ncbi:MAG: phosphotransferase enzyme family protein [Myxococcota bacterium]
MSGDALRAARAFRLAGEPVRAEPLGSGHIHDTFSVSCAGPDGEVRYVLQRLNTRVFPDPDAVVENAELLTRTLAEGLAGADAGRRVLHCLRTPGGGLSHRDAEGGLWRGFDRIEGVRTFDRMESPAMARRAARAFGDFAARVARLDPARLRIPLPGFHDFDARVDAFERSVSDDAAGRLGAVAADVAAMGDAVAALRRALPERLGDRLPPRIAHNDCKLDNVLFDAETGEALCVIDLDTVMPGTLLHDFGGLVRTGACPEPEDSRRLDRVRVDEALYRGLAAGYLEGAGSLLSPDEIELLPLGGPLIALEDGVRFLTDHLKGDVYYRVARPDHNLDRARNQLRLALDLLARLDAARGWIDAAR